MIDAALHSSYIGHLHRISPAAPAAGSCANASAGNQSGNSDREDRLDNDPVPTMRLHLHSIAAAELRYYSSSTEAAPCVSGSSCGKKNKKRFDKYNNMGYKGSIN